MQFTFFHLMPYRPLDMAKRHKHRAACVVLPNDLYDPKKGADEYQSYIDQLVYAEKLGFDVIAVNPKAGRAGITCKIQVKSRWATDYDHKFVLKQNLDCDFVVFAELNRGYRDYHHRDKSVPVDAGKQPPRIFVFPANKLNSLIKVSSGWSKVALADIPRYESYKDRWDLVRKFLKMPAVGAPRES